MHPCQRGFNRSREGNIGFRVFAKIWFFACEILTDIKFYFEKIVPNTFCENLILYEIFVPTSTVHSYGMEVKQDLP